jgi:carbonic anhydrase/acetyltransferase-like protein (isoleucine patch superfamily)
MAIYNLGDRQPVLGREAWVAPNATVIGDVRLGDAASIWWNAVVRGDNDTITIGAGSNIQDGSVLHADAGVPLTHRRERHRRPPGHAAWLHHRRGVADRHQVGDPQPCRDRPPLHHRRQFADPRKAR